MKVYVRCKIPTYYSQIQGKHENSRIHSSPPPPPKKMQEGREEVEVQTKTATFGLLLSNL